MNRHAIRIVLALAAIAAALWAGSGLAYDTYTDTMCSSCHSGFESKGALHDVHTSFISSSCTMCHPTSPGSKPVNTSSAGDAASYSCLGCHGRDYGGSTGMQAAGLRAHHAANGVGICGGCHGGDPTPLGENIAPPHYSFGSVSLSVCSDNLDNDGDDAYDGDDSDCSVAVDETTWGKIKALYK
jgi:hypothetical protein